MNQDTKWLGRLIWTVLALAACWRQAPSFVAPLRPSGGLIYDFFQEWASARNRFEGLPIYTHQGITASRYLNFDPGTSVNPLISYNAHPPTSVLLALPLARLDYPDAFLAWSLLSLLALGVTWWLIGRQFPGGLTVWSILPLTALLLWCNPFRQQMLQGQLNLVLLLLLTAVWAADRSEHLWWAGALLGAATAIKLFPGFLFLYFVARRQWRPVVAGAISFLVLTALTVGVLGPECYRDYVTLALPSLEKYRVYWPNLSLAGFWHKLFNSEGSHVVPLWQNRPLAWAATFVSDAVVIALTAWFAWRSRSSRDRDLAFALTIVAMLLVSPITWDHYFTLLFLPLLLLWVWMPPAGLSRITFWLIVMGLWLSPLVYWMLFVPGVTIKNWGELTATPAQTLTALSMQTYVLLSLFVFTILVIRRSHPALAEDDGTHDRKTLTSAAVYSPETGIQ